MCFFIILLKSVHLFACHNKFLVYVFFSQNCPPVSPNMATTPDFDSFTITITDFAPVLVTDCQYQQPISVEKDYSITITINNEGGSSEPTTVMFGE